MFDNEIDSISTLFLLSIRQFSKFQAQLNEKYIQRERTKLIISQNMRIFCFFFCLLEIFSFFLTFVGFTYTHTHTKTDLIPRKFLSNNNKKFYTTKKVNIVIVLLQFYSFFVFCFINKNNNEKSNRLKLRTCKIE